jgi:hypothetical protein
MWLLLLYFRVVLVVSFCPLPVIPPWLHVCQVACEMLKWLLVKA